MAKTTSVVATLKFKMAASTECVSTSSMYLMRLTNHVNMGVSSKINRKSSDPGVA